MVKFFQNAGVTVLFLALVSCLLSPCFGATDPCSTGKLMSLDERSYYPVTDLKAPGFYSVDDRSKAIPYHYTINVCDTVPCDGTSLVNPRVAGCQNWTVDGRAARMAIGQLTSATYGFDVPEPYEGFTVTYGDGDVCAHAQPRQMIIKFLCSTSDVTPRLVYDGETSHCLFEFTVYAKNGPCPVQIADSPAPPPPPVCQQSYYPDPASDSYYEPHRLALAKTEPYFATSDEKGVAYTYQVNVCGEVSCPHSTLSQQHAACQEWNIDGVASGVSLGGLTTVSFQPAPEGGEGYTVLYNHGDNCHSGSPRQTRISVVCSPLDFTPRFEFFGEFSKCIFDFTLYARDGACPVHTQSVTPPPPSQQCPTTIKLSDKLSYYSVRALTQATSSPYSYTDDSGAISIKYELNVCAAVPCGSGSPASACQSWTTDGKNYQKSLGQVGLTGYTLGVPETSGYTLYFEGGEACSNGDIRHTIVHAVCDTTIKGQLFQFMGETSHCEFEFSLRGSNACPTIVAPAPVVGCDGTLLTTDGGSHYPFKELALPLPFHDSDPDGGPGDEPFDYYVSMCSPVSCPYSSLPSGVISGCQSWKDPDSGTPHSKAIGRIDQAKFTSKSNNKGFTAEFGGGDPCSGDVARTTRIDVTCSPEDATPRLVYQGETEHCVFEFTLSAAKGACPVVNAEAPAPPTTPPKKGLSGGVIFVILLLVLAVVAGAGFAGYRYYKKRRGGVDVIAAATFTASSCSNLKSRLPCCGAKEYAFAQLGQDDANEDDAY